MNPRLISITGPLRNSSVELEGSSLSVGREPNNQLIINDISVSRQHCVIIDEAGIFKVRDLGSHNGTFVNGIPITERILEHGDQLGIGNSLFLFMLRETDVQPKQIAIGLDDSTFDTKTGLQLRLEDVLYTMARDFSTLTKISQAINSIHKIGELQWALLGLILDNLPAQRGAIVLFDPQAKEPHSSVVRERPETASSQLSVSRTVVSKVMQERIALLTNPVTSSDSLRGVKSLKSSKTASILCVPLVFGDRCLGVIYLYTDDPLNGFDEDNLKLLVAIANNAAVAVENARHVEWLQTENQRLRSDFRIEHRMIGESARMCQVYKVISQVASSNSTVLIRGESGTGKELAARAIHDNSPRANKQFIALNCATLTEALLESELFGHEKGAFTGAVTQKIGRLEAGTGGTLFLDEVAEMSLIVQAKLLRVLQEREFVRIGGTRQIKVDIRLIAATNRDLQEAIAKRTFRLDLYYRLNVVSITMPPLRERVEDIPLLVRYFAAKYGEKCKRSLGGISPEANSYLINYDWPGNVRELENVIERAIVLGQTAIIQSEDLPEAILENEASREFPVAEYHKAVNDAKRQIIMKAMERADGNYAKAARTLGIHVNNLHRLIRKMGMKSLLGK